ncbi:MAG: hypothetical protein AUJ19_02510 [Parcubacteria group bacterium CG1_02_58_44]|nr:MAG: hypothetical protein AUJ19_02510 [Parcubacteria group bacterium CG1_02_58_44]
MTKFMAALAILFLMTGCESVPPAEGLGQTNNNYVLKFVENLDLDGDQFIAGDVTSEARAQCSYEGSDFMEEFCVGQVTAALKGSGDCDGNPYDDASPCPKDPVAAKQVDCSNSNFTMCSKCINPGATEVNDGVDNNCDGNIDEGFEACPAGYTGSGTNCTDINECATGNGGCSVNATCANTPGSFTCSCNAGYTGNGVTCTDVNECATGNGGCSVNATCANTVGSFTCSCNAGFTGNGVVCVDSCLDVTCSLIGQLCVLGQCVNPTCDPTHDVGGDETVGDCFALRDEAGVTDVYGYYCAEEGVCTPYEDQDGDQFADVPERFCADGIDGDLDGKIDTADSDCAPAPPTTPCDGVTCGTNQFCSAGLCLNAGQAVWCWDAPTGVDTNGNDLFDPSCHEMGYVSPLLWLFESYVTAPPFCKNAPVSAQARPTSVGCCIAPAALVNGAVGACVTQDFYPYAL